MSSLARRLIYTDLRSISPSRLSIPHRLSSSQVGIYRGGLRSHTLAGIAGGLTIIGLGYGWYHFSDIKRAVDSVRRAKFFIQETKKSLIDKKNSNKALIYLRKVAKSYVAVLPGADIIVDQAFDSVDEIVDAHAEEATAIANSAYAEIQEIVKNGDSEGSPGKALKVMYVLRRRLGEIKALGVKVGGEALDPLWDKFPEVGGKIGTELEELQKLMRDRGPDSKKILGDAQQQVKVILAEGINNETLVKARALIKEKTLKLRGHESSGDGDGNKTSGGEDDSGK
ncbi:hypothetical protein BDZ94DRAFT_1305381 [Collybia nuda]|uniref:Uncharacterized protein n=1 Tax=Collybia nuda TaxID=64659 RepID=A0A9P5YEY5_9AGAR|nr:hypothetical protein BDZ94DRAFT_1305381 [Collybia nuda]